jgi:membrane-associated phospholipid phosphatase
VADPSYPRTALRLLLGWAVACAVLLGAGWLLTHLLAGSVGAWDDDVARAIAERRTATLGAVADVGTLLADTPVGAGFAALVAVVVSLWKRSWLPVLVLGLATAGAGAMYKVGTTLINRDRPPVEILDPGLVPDHSFPSGHVGTAVAAYAGALVVLWWLSPRSRPWVWPLALVPLFVGACRLYQGAHHVSDVVVSLLVVSAWLALVVRLVLVPGVSRSPGRHSARPARSGSVPG